MAKHIQLNIAEPCHENWDDMTKAEKGRFCAACQKQVIDFTGMSDSQVAAFFKKPSTGSVCGRLTNDQMSRDIAIPGKRIPWVKYFFQLTLPLFLASLKSNAQKGKIFVVHSNSVMKTAPIVMQGFVALDRPDNLPSQIKGRIIDEQGKPVPYASITIKETPIGTSADSSGLFSLHLPLGAVKVNLIISSVGFMPGEICATRNDIRENRELIVRLKAIVMTEVLVTSSNNIGILEGRVGGITVTRTDTNNVKPIPAINMPPAMRIYPNPVQSGSSININCDKMDESYYSFQLLTLSGQVSFQKEMWIDKEARVLNMTIPKVAPGTYLLRMTSRQSGKSFTDKIVIE